MYCVLHLQNIQLTMTVLCSEVQCSLLHCSELQWNWVRWSVLQISHSSQEVVDYPEVRRRRYRTLYTVHCALYTAHCTLYIVHFKLYFIARVSQKCKTAIRSHCITTTLQAVKESLVNLKWIVNSDAKNQNVNFSYFWHTELSCMALQ